MANHILSASLQQFHQLSIAPSTKRTYGTCANAFLHFCDQYHIPLYSASSLTLQYFCAHLAQHITYKTIKVFLASIRLVHLEQGHPDPTHDDALS